MRAAAKVEKIAFPVQGDFLILRNRSDDFRFIGFALRLEKSHGLVARPFFPNHFFVFSCQFSHLFLDFFEIFRRKRAFVREVVIKTIVDHRTNGDLRIGKQRLDRIGQQVSGGMTDNVQAVGIFGGYNGQIRVLVNNKRRIHQLGLAAVDGYLTGKRRLAQAGRDGRRNFSDLHGLGKFTLGTIG